MFSYNHHLNHWMLALALFVAIWVMLSKGERSLVPLLFNVEINFIWFVPGSTTSICSNSVEKKRGMSNIHNFSILALYSLPCCTLYIWADIQTTTWRFRGFQEICAHHPCCLSPYPLHKCMDTSLTLSWKNGKWHFSLRPKGTPLDSIPPLTFRQDEVENGANILRDWLDCHLYPQIDYNVRRKCDGFFRHCCMAERKRTFVLEV